MSIREIISDDCVVRFDDTRELRDAVFERLLAFYVKHESFHGESIMQSDSPQIEAPELLSEIADDMFRFSVRWDE